MNPAHLTLIPIDTADELEKFDYYLRMGTDEEERPKVTSSRQAYCWTITLFLRFCDNGVASIDLAKDWLKSLEAKGNGPSTINRHIWALKSYFRFKGGDTFKLRGLKTESRKPGFLRDEEWDQLLTEANRPLLDKYNAEYAKNRAKLELALLWAYCGGALRASEAINMELTDVDKKGFLRVHRKGGTEEFVPVEKIVIQALLDYIKTRSNNGPYVFPGKTPGDHMARRTAQAIIKALCVRAGLPNAHVHMLRHTAGYQLRKLGASERDIQDVMGHKNIATTQIYTHLVREDLAKRLPKRFQNTDQGKLL
ncbi:hypothetical protein LCGC14_1521260 [marine sediment metagenome]|uniref:Tyr recombinase domain-containing protein n=1 Tax=marine sediment metagenome TaxID=412755 RepID=A0A0F9LE52_9ZZZZ